MEGATINTVFLFGRPGSGKGTQAKLLAETFGWKVFSTGDRFKEIRGGSTPFSERVRAMYDQGKLFPDWFASYLFEEAMFSLDPSAGIICEGFPRTMPQAELADDVLLWLERPYRVLHLSVPDDDVLERQIKRAQVEHRPDSDSPEKIQARLATYRAQTEPVLAFFREKGVLTDVDGTPDIETIHTNILTQLKTA